MEEVKQKIIDKNLHSNILILISKNNERYKREYKKIYILIYLY